MFDTFKNSIAEELEKIKSQGLYKFEKAILTPQQARIRIEGGREMLNFCSNNYAWNWIE